MLRLMLGSIRGRIGNVAGALIAITIATSLIAGTCMLIFAASDTPITSDRYANTTAIVQVDPSNPNPVEDDAPLTSVPRIDASLSERIAAMPGVAQAIPATSFYAQLLDRDGEPIDGPDGADSYGFPWSNAALTPFTLTGGNAPQSGQIAIDARLANETGLGIGDSITVLSAQMPRSYTISGIVAPPNGDSLPRQATIFFADSDAAAITGLFGTAEFIGVIAEPGTDAKTLATTIRDGLNDPDLRVLRGENLAQVDPTSDKQMLEDVAALLGTMAGFSGFVSIFVLAGTFAFSILQRNREIGLLRSIGMTPRQVKLMIAGEGLILALIASAIAIPFGYAIAAGIGAALQHFDLAPDGISPSFSPWSFLIAIGGAIAISQIAAFGAARRAAKISPIEALRESSAPQKRLGWMRLLTGFGFVAGGIALFAVLPGLDTDAQVAMSLGIAAVFLIAASRLGPLIVLPCIAVLGRVLRRLFGQPGELARLNSRHSSHRVASVTSPLILAIGFACLMFFLTATMQTATIVQSDERTTAEYVLVADSPGLPVALTDQVAALPGVAAISPVAVTPVTIVGKHDGWVEYLEFSSAGINAGTIDQVLDLDITKGSLDGFGSGDVALARMTAEQINAKIGQPVDIVLEDGTRVTLNVAAIFDNGLGFPDLAIDNELMLAHTTQPLVQQIYVAAQPGAEKDLRATLESLQAQVPTLEVMSGDQYVDTIKQSAIDGAWAIYLIVGVSVLFAAIAVINTMAMSTSERAREFSLLRLIGATDRQITLMVLGEALIVLIVGVGLGVLIGWLSMIPASTGMVGDLSAITMPPLETISVLVFSAVIAIGAHILPARFALRLDPVSSIGVKQ
jgi:putative ABC transport system permease protein